MSLLSRRCLEGLRRCTIRSFAALKDSEDEQLPAFSETTTIPAPSVQRPDVSPLTKLGSEENIITHLGGEDEPQTPVSEDVITWLGDEPKDIPDVKPQVKKPVYVEKPQTPRELISVHDLAFELMPKFARRNRPRKLKEEDAMNVTTAIEMVLKEAPKEYDHTLEIHIDLDADPRKSDQLVRGVSTLPHGTGKKLSIAVFADGTQALKAKELGVDLVGGVELIHEIEETQGANVEHIKRCIATPSLMKHLAKVGRILGPRGLMPNPKMGTLTEDVSEAISKLKQGQIEFRLDRMGSINTALGKMSFGHDKLLENLLAFGKDLLQSKPQKFSSKPNTKFIKKITICSTEGRGFPIIVPSMVDLIKEKMSILLAKAIVSTDSRFDEYLWTKGTWNDFKLVKPFDTWRVEDDPLVAQHSAKFREQECEFISTDGPGRQTVFSDAASESSYQNWLTNLVNQAVAGETVLGIVCDSVVELGWKHLVQTLMKLDTVEEEDVESVFEEVCLSVIPDVLSRYTLIKNKDENISGEEWMLSPRKPDTVESYEESGAIQEVCDQIVESREITLIDKIMIGAKLYLGLLETTLKLQLDKAADAQANKEVWNESGCQDAHPRCEEWADRGECTINPNYMLYFCKISCGKCNAEPTFTQQGKHFLSKESINELESASQTLSNQMKNEVCAQFSASKKTNPNMQVLEYESVLEGNEIADVHKALYIELKGKCLLLYRGWWTYELCFYNKLSQYHMDKDGHTPLQTIVIGNFRVQEGNKDPPLQLGGSVLKRLGLAEEPRNYIEQLYESGDACKVNGGLIKRHAKVRFMRSKGIASDKAGTSFLSATIEETEKCTYTLNVFLPLLCHYSQYKS